MMFGIEINEAAEQAIKKMLGDTGDGDRLSTVSPRDMASFFHGLLCTGLEEHTNSHIWKESDGEIFVTPM